MRSKQGFALVSLLLALVISAIGIYIGVQIINSTQSAQVKAEIRGQIHSNHLLLLAVLRSTRNIKRALAIGEASGHAGYIASIASTNSNLRECLKRTPASGLDCTSLASSWTPLPDFGGLNLNTLYSRQLNSCTAGTANCDLKKAVLYQINCPTSTECTDIQVQITDNYVGKQSFLKAMAPDQSVLSFRAEELVGIQGVDYSCTKTGAIVTDISSDGRIANCNNLTGTNTCTTTTPQGASLELLQTYGQGYPDNSGLCTTPQQVTCLPVLSPSDTNYTSTNFGFQTLGIQTGQSICQSATSTSYAGQNLQIVSFTMTEQYSRQSDTATYEDDGSAIVAIPPGGIPSGGIAVNLPFLSVARMPASITSGFPQTCINNLNSVQPLTSVDLLLTNAGLQLIKVNVDPIANAGPNPLFQSSPPLPGSNYVNFDIPTNFCP